MGGALGLLLAIFASLDDRISKPITCVSIGLLLLGDSAFQKSVEQLEALGWLRNLCITNEHDPVPCLPPFDWYRRAGMQLELLQGSGHVLGHHAYCNRQAQMPRNSFSGLWRSYQAFGATAGSMTDWLRLHMVPEYLGRLERERPALEQLYLKDCCRSADIVGNHFKTRL